MELHALVLSQQWQFFGIRFWQKLGRCMVWDLGIYIFIGVSGCLCILLIKFLLNYY